ncbi:kynureninase [Ginsengibacter hankyongi]|nr:kynureninase [Ginsengibacter hankyongi]
MHTYPFFFDSLSLFNIDKNMFENTLAFAQQLDKEDPLNRFREKFYIPFISGKESIYFTGNSLGLQPKTAQDYILDDLEDWANYGVEGHFHGRNPWTKYHEMFPPKLAPILGALEEEIVVMNQLTINLHLLLITFYRPTKDRYKIICEAKAFPSDQYALQSQALIAGLDPEKVIIEVTPRDGEQSIRNEDIIATIKEHGNEVAIVIIGGVNYYTGQVFDMNAITAAARGAGAFCGFDLAHAVGNIELKLHDWNVDFACWCSYKYLNSGPGAVAGAFIHQRHIADKSLVRLRGWWGTNKQTRFKMEKEFDAIPTAEGWMVSNSPILNMSCHKASLDIFDEAGYKNIIAKMKKLGAYLFFILDDINASSEKKVIEIITPRNENEHGCQVSMFMLEKGKEIFELLKNNSVIVDWREPNVIRLAPVPLYNTFEDIYRFGEIIKSIIV